MSLFEIPSQSHVSTHEMSKNRVGNHKREC